ncbi:MAG: hypothetical protein HY698_19070 [Deltaproteobacteria bacterium]|nr:hypothetical protein [Deltaproteobacteria bacterium]
MAVPVKHVLSQGPVIRALGEVALSSILQGHRNGAPSKPLATPGPEIRAVLPPRPADLIRDYLRHVGGDPSAYRGVVPPHLFPQWGFGLAAKTLRGIPYPLAKVMNGGCRLEVKSPLPMGEPLHVTARLEGIDDNGKRAILHQKVVTGTSKVPEAIVAHLYAYVPLSREKNGAGKAEKKEKQRPRVPHDVRELAYWKIPANAGWEFAKLTGDFNPVHWVPPYARALGFRHCILHGFSTMARAVEGLNRNLRSGATQWLDFIDVKFSKPLILPARVGLYVKDNRIFVGDAPGGGACLEGTFAARQQGE